MANKIVDLDIYNAVTPNNPDGSLKDRVYSAPGVVSEEGSRAYGRFIQDLLNVFHRLVRDDGGSLNGATDEQLNSQFYDALVAKMNALDVSISRLIQGATQINETVATKDIQFDLSNLLMKYTNNTDGNFLGITEQGLTQSDTDGNAVDLAFGYTLSRKDAPGTVSAKQDYNGHQFFGSSHPNEVTATKSNKCFLSLNGSGLTFSNSAVTGDYQWVASGVYSTNIPVTCFIYSITAYFTDQGGSTWSAPCITKLTNNAGKWDILLGIQCGGQSAGFQPLVTSMLVEINFDGQGL
jgi:hypothetical protein